MSKTERQSREEMRAVMVLRDEVLDELVRELDRLAVQHPADIESYTDGKEQFIEEVDAWAAAWRQRRAKKMRAGQKNGTKGESPVHESVNRNEISSDISKLHKRERKFAPIESRICWRGIRRRSGVDCGVDEGRRRIGTEC